MGRPQREFELAPRATSGEIGGLTARDLVCPFPSEVHPATVVANARTLRWLTEHGMLDPGDASNRLATERYTWLAGRMFPSADEARFQLISDFTSWIFHHDDVCDESLSRADSQAMARLFERELALMKGQRMPDPADPSERALYEIGRRFDCLAPDPTWFTRFAQNFGGYLEGCLWEAKNRASHRTPDVDEYLSLRPYAGAVWLSLEMVELVSGRLPFEVRQHRGIQQLRQFTSDLAAWHNDIYSVMKELQADDPHNLVIILQRAEGLELTAALSRAVRRSNDQVRRFDETVACLEGTTDCSSDVHALRLFIRGALDYLLESERYVESTQVSPIF